MDELLKKIKAIIDKKLPLISNLSNVSALLNQMDAINWCGFYLNKDNTLYLGPFQGEVACTVIPYQKGVCGTCLANKKTIIVADVNQFKGHIACSKISRSEIVTPIIKDGQVVAVIDIDSPVLNRFSLNEQLFLEEVASQLKELF